MKCTIVTKRRRLRRGGSSRPVRLVGNAQGLILPLTLLVMVILGVLAAAILSIGGSEAQIASNHLRAIQAQFLAEAGLEHAFNTLRTTPSANLTTNATVLVPVPNIADNLPVGGAGNYTVRYQSAGTYTFRVVSTGTSAIGGAQQIRRAIMSTYFYSNDAIRTNGPLTITGSTDVEDPTSTTGVCGNVHTNDRLDVVGSHVHIEGDATASGAYNTSGNPNVGSGSGGSTPREIIPVINPTDFLNAAKASPAIDHLYQMKANGQVLDGNGGLITTLVSGNNSSNTYCGWTYTAGSSAEWEANNSSGTPCNGTFYLEGNATVSSSPGSTSTPWKTTLIATGDLIVSGQPTIGDDAAYTVKDTLFVAGLDVKISGNSNTLIFNGLIAAHEQFDLSGTSTINGFIIGEDATHTSGTVTSNTVNGHIRINYNCGSQPPVQSPLQILSWGL